MGVRRWAAGYGRTALAAVGSGTLLLFGLAPSGGAASATAISAQDAFSNGTAKATAVVSRVSPGVGSLELAIRGGVAVAELKNQLGQASAQSLDLGLIGTTLTAENCRGDQPLRPDQLPQPTRVDNRKGEASASSDEAPIAGATFGGGREEAWADKTPLAGATSTSAGAFGPVVSIDGGRADAVTEIVDGAARQAHASVDASIDIAGVVQLRGMHWEALHRTGADPHAAASFEVGRAAVLGAPVPVDSLRDLESTVNTALAPSGISVAFPRVERFEEPSDVVRMTPMRVVLKDSPVGKAVIGPVLNATREQREQMFVQLASAICETASFLFIADIAVSVASGTGFMAVEVGGAEATTGELVVGNPFGTAQPLPNLGEAVPAAPAPGPPAVGVVGAAPPAAPGTSGGDATSTPIASLGPLESVCETVHPSADTSCSRGALLALGIIGVAATVGVAALDLRNQRRRAAAAEVVA